MLNFKVRINACAALAAAPTRAHYGASFAAVAAALTECLLALNDGSVATDYTSLQGRFFHHVTIASVNQYLPLLSIGSITRELRFRQSLLCLAFARKTLTLYSFLFSFYPFIVSSIHRFIVSFILALGYRYKETLHACCVNHACHSCTSFFALPLLTLFSLIHSFILALGYRYKETLHAQAVSSLFHVLGAMSDNDVADEVSVSVGGASLASEHVDVDDDVNAAFGYSAAVRAMVTTPAHRALYARLIKVQRARVDKEAAAPAAAKVAQAAPVAGGRISTVDPHPTSAAIEQAFNALCRAYAVVDGGDVGVLGGDFTVECSGVAADACIAARRIETAFRSN
jgi:hypothetical protein